MNLRFLILILILALSSCKKQARDAVTTDWDIISKRVKFRENSGNLELNFGEKSYKLPTAKLPFKRIVFLNASLIGYVTALGAEDRIVGVSSPEYIYSENIQALVRGGKIANVGNEQKYNFEKIIALKPDAVFTNYIKSFDNTYNLLTQNGITVIFLDEYLEQEPLQKTAYLKVFGKLLNREQEAGRLYAEIEKNYNTLKNLAQKVEKRPEVIANEMYGAQWFMPGGRTGTARFLDDAGGNYILRNTADDKALPLGFEEVYGKAQNATVWVNLGSHKSKKELLAVNPGYDRLPTYRNGRLYMLTGREKGRANDFFESGVVRADLVLKDYIKILHPELLPGYSLYYMQDLK